MAKIFPKVAPRGMCFPTSAVLLLFTGQRYYPALPLFGESWPSFELTNQSFKCSEFSKFVDLFIQSWAKIFQARAVQGTRSRSRTIVKTYKAKSNCKKWYMNNSFT